MLRTVWYVRGRRRWENIVPFYDETHEHVHEGLQINRGYTVSAIDLVGSLETRVVSVLGNHDCPPRG